MHKLFGRSETEKYKRQGKAGRRTVVSVILSAAILLSLSPVNIYARQGDSGYEGGISSGETPSMTNLSSTSKYEFQYQEPCFLSGVPVIMSGTLTLSKKLKEDTKTKTQTLTSTYVYSLRNNGTQNTLSRTLTFVTIITPKDNGQKVESTQLTVAKENIKLGNAVYTIGSKDDYELTKSILNDTKPAVNYYSGEIMSKKRYRMGTTGSDYVVVNSTTGYTGYDQYWSSAETQIIKQTIEQQRAGKAPVQVGDISMEVSTTTKKELEYYENLPEQSSIAGGYVQTQANENILKFTADLSELDSKRNPTIKVVNHTASLKLESFPTSTRMVSPGLNQIRGHASEENIALLFGLEAFKNPAAFDPQEYISRAEFVDAFLKVAPAVPLDPAFKPKKTTTRTSRNVEIVPPFADVAVSNPYFTSIEDATKRAIISGNGKSKFRPDELITVAEAVAIMVNALGLNGLAPNPVPVTGFRDNDKIPSYARGPMYVAERLGLISGDTKGYIYPDNKITKAGFSDMMRTYIDYMGKDLRKEYVEKLISY